uniref:Aminopeptidase n=1 Tax=Neolamprologus brichardi TaxID=32507 RepID=A0A3Q4GII6_NEOBR
MGKGFFISKAVAVVCVVVAISAVATIIALSVVYAQEKSKNQETPTTPTTTTTTTTAGPGTQTTTPSTPKEPWQHYRLPDSFSPISYNVTLWPRLTPNPDGLYIFSGYSTVLFTCVKETDLILIHSNKLNFTMFDGYHAQLKAVDGASAPQLKKSWLEVPTQYLVIQLSSPLQAGSTYELFTEFVGELADDLGGFYRSEYNEDGVQKILATTQMQPTDARKAFPCFDEPAMKAVFHMTLIHPHGTVALSNSMNYGKFFSCLTSFGPTEIMSTYLLAFVVCDFGYIQSDLGADVLIRIWARRKAIDEGQGKYALEKTGPILSFFENYYKIPYPLKKSDQIALPDFSAGAMENWGLITYRETALLYNPAVSSNGDKEWVATVISHELAHMWFGNLVTTKWWNDLWLNEGFATYVSYLGANYTEPDWNMSDLIVLNEIIGVMAVDALASSHPLSSKEADVMRPEDINALFDSITYSKSFIICLQMYLEEFKYKNTVYQDLWKNLQTAVDNAGIQLPHSVEVIMNRWILQMGFPVVTIDTSTGKISQKHFLLNPDSVVDVPSEFNYEWFVPITWIKTGAAKDQYWLLTKEDMKIGASEWLIANIDMKGFYRVNYDSENWDRILTKLSTQHQVNALTWGCGTGVEGCKELTTAWFKEWMDNPDNNMISPNLRTTVYCSAIAEGGVVEWDFAWRMYKNATIASEAEKLLYALSCTKQPWLLNRYLEYCLDPTMIRKQDATFTINYIAGNPIGQPLAWDFIRPSNVCLFFSYGGGSISFGRLITGVTKRFSSEFEYKQLLQFKEDNINQLGSAASSLEQALERTKANMDWLALNKKLVFDWFTDEISGTV